MAEKCRFRIITSGHMETERERVVDGGPGEGRTGGEAADGLVPRLGKCILLL